MNSLNEGYIVNKDDIEINMNKFVNGDSNILLITGLSGSGKSTLGESLANKYHAEYIELDLFEHVYMFENENQLKEAGEVFYQYFKSNPDVYNQIKNRSISNENLISEINNFVKYAIRFCSSNKSSKYVIEGMQIYQVYNKNSSPIKKYPIIIKGTSAVSSLMRRIGRDNNSNKTLIQRIKAIMDNASLKCINWYLDEEKTLKMFRDNLQLESYLYEGLNDYKMYFISEKDLDGKTLRPRIPKNFLTQYGYEDSKTPRVCFSSSIDGCLAAMSANIESKQFYVYTADGNYDIYYPGKDAVPDCEITEEIWVKEPVKIKKIMLIEVGKAKDKPYRYSYGNNYAYLYKWNYNVLERYDNVKTESGMATTSMPKIPDIHDLLDYANPKKVWLTSDWHFFKNHYKKEANYVNTQKILTWCRQNIKEDDIFMYLGDISFRFANKKDQKESQRLMASIHGIKVLIIGNHDAMLGEEYFADCGFDYVYERLDWQNIVFTHRPINMDLYPEEYLNIHGHMHKWREYNTTDGQKNINVYPWYYDNKPVSLDYILTHKDKLIEGNKRSSWLGMGESAVLETKRSNLPDSKFGIPEDRKYPLDSKKHVSSAIKLFGHAEESKKKELAKRIKVAANKYNINIPETAQVAKYLSEANMNNNTALEIPSMVKNIIFDMGSVLVNAHTLETIKAREDIPDEYAEELYSLITNDMWTGGLNPNLPFMDIEPAKKCIVDALTKDSRSYLIPYIDKIFDTFLPAMYVYNYVYELLDALREAGFKLYYLSNWDKYCYDLEEPFFRPLLEKFDGGIFSFEVHNLKPNISIYRTFLERFNLNPETCLFFDDKDENIEAAKLVGMKAIKFDSEVTPAQILKALDPNIDFDPDKINNIILVTTDGMINAIDITNIKEWHADVRKDPLYWVNKNYYSTIEEALNNCARDRSNQAYIYTRTEDNKPVSLGIVFRHTDSWDWLVQYPIEYKDGKIYLKEWAMANCNPVKGITKPFILKIYNDSDSVFGGVSYAFCPDIVSDRFLIIDEDAQLDIVRLNEIDACKIEAYQFIGDKRNIKNIEVAYHMGNIVDNTFFYTTLTGKPMLTEDQIDFDSNFTKVDFMQFKEDMLSRKATLTEQAMGACKYEISAAIPTDMTRHIKTYADEAIKLCEDLNGYYVRNIYTNARTFPVKDPKMITEAMIKSILK